MLSLIFFSIAIIAAWTAITLMKEGPKNKDIKITLREMQKNGLGAFKYVLVLAENIKSLFQILAEEQTTNESIKKAGAQTISPTLIEIKERKKKDAA